MISFRFEGGTELARNLDLLSEPVAKRILREGLKEAGEPMRKRMSQLAPHEPGKPDLRDNIGIAPARGLDERETTVAVGPTIQGFYGSFVELGTSTLSPQPFARPAFDEMWQTVLKLFGASMWREIARRGGHRRAVEPTTVVPGTLGRLL